MYATTHVLVHMQLCMYLCICMHMDVSMNVCMCASASDMIIS